MNKKEGKILSTRGNLQKKNTKKQGIFSLNENDYDNDMQYPKK